MNLIKNKFIWLFSFIALGFIGWKLSRPMPLACSFDQDQELVYDFTMNSLSKLNPKSMLSQGQRSVGKLAESSTLGYQGRLNLKHQATEVDGFLLAGVLTNSSGSGDFNKSLISEIEKPFMVKVDRRCRFTSLAFMVRES